MQRCFELLFASNVITFFTELNCAMHLMHNNLHAIILGLGSESGEQRCAIIEINLSCMTENNDLHNEICMRSH